MAIKHGGHVRSSQYAAVIESELDLGRPRAGDEAQLRPLWVPLSVKAYRRAPSGRQRGDHPLGVVVVV